MKETTNFFLFFSPSFKTFAPFGHRKDLCRRLEGFIQVFPLALEWME